MIFTIEKIAVAVAICGQSAVFSAENSDIIAEIRATAIKSFGDIAEKLTTSDIKNACRRAINDNKLNTFTARQDLFVKLVEYTIQEYFTEVPAFTAECLLPYISNIPPATIESCLSDLYETDPYLKRVTCYDKHIYYTV